MNSGHVRYSVYLCDEVDSGVGIRGSEDVFLGQVMSGYHFQSKQSEKNLKILQNLKKKSAKYLQNSVTN